jgi:hypothetical protein
MRGYRTVILEPGGIQDVLLPVAVLCGFSIVFGLLAWRRFETAEEKVFFA